MGFQHSKSFSAAWDICQAYAVLKEIAGRDAFPSSPAAARGKASHTLFYGLKDDLWTVDDIGGLASCDRVFDNVLGFVAHFPFWASRHLFHHEISFGLDMRGNAIPRDGAPIGGTIDLIGVVDGTCYVIDLKTGQVKDDVHERTLYVAAARAILPKAINDFTFMYLYPHGIYRWDYHYKTPRTVEVGCGN